MTPFLLSQQCLSLGFLLGSTSPSPDLASSIKANIIHSLKSGYRLIDTAQYYGIESIVGSAIRSSGIPRSEIIVVTKFWGEWHHNPSAALRKSLEDLDIEYIDVFLMHWPNASCIENNKTVPLRIDESPTFLQTWLMMEKLVGPSCRGIGVSNFTQKTLGALIDGGATRLPCINQVELHALNPALRLVPWCRERGIHVMSWR